jgi:predicted outer membrane protein
VRSATGAGVVVTALAATLAALLYPVWSFHLHTEAAKRAATRTVATRYGPLTAADRAFVLRVRQAGLWELPAGEQAMERGDSKAVRDAGERLVKGDTALDGQVRDVASRLGIALPDEPGHRERGWLSELDAAHGRAYETTFADYLRRSQGEIFETMGRVRNDTRNTLVRRLATTGSRTVLAQMTALEKTGLVDYDAITPARDRSRGAASAVPSGRPAATPPPLPPAWSRPGPEARHGTRHSTRHGARHGARHREDAVRTPPGRAGRPSATPESATPKSVTPKSVTPKPGAPKSATPKPGAPKPAAPNGGGRGAAQGATGKQPGHR